MRAMCRFSWEPARPRPSILTKVNMNDCVSAYFWRNVDLDLGALELFDDVNFAGNRNVLFLGEWPRGTIVKISGWWLNDRVSSARWNAIDDRESVDLFENDDGSGRSFENIQGWGSARESGDLRQENFNDCASAFRWNGVAPKKEEIKPFDLAPDMSNATSITLHGEAINSTGETVSVPVEFSDEEAQTLTVTTTETHVVETGVAVEPSFSYSEAGVTAGVKSRFR